MKQLYLFVLLWAFGLGSSAQAQNWRPFRPNGDVHAFRGVSADTILTLRLDSAAREGVDSLYYFNRIMRQISPIDWRKSHNNLFGQRLRYVPAQRTYNLEWYEPATSTTSAVLVVWVLKPFARVGDTWSSFNIDYPLSTTLQSRATQLIDGVIDSVATFQFGNGKTVVLSKNHGLVSAPANLGFWFGAGIRSSQLTLARRPASAGQSYYNPLQILDMQPGNEIGYEEIRSAFPCFRVRVLRRILTRQLTADSLIYTFQEQKRSSVDNTAGCTSADPVISPPTTGRMAASRRTGMWAGQNARALLPDNVELLSYAYRPSPVPGNNSVVMGTPIVLTRQFGQCGPAVFHQRWLYRLNNTDYVSSNEGAAAWYKFTGMGVGTIHHEENGVLAGLAYRVTYARRTVGGNVQICGDRTNFELLLPNRKASQTASFQLYPNPAGTAATLTLPTAAAVGTTVRLLDVLGRAAGNEQVLTAGQTTATLALQGLTPGLYLVEVQAPGQLPQHVRLQHE